MRYMLYYCKCNTFLNKKYVFTILLSCIYMTHWLRMRKLWIVYLESLVWLYPWIGCLEWPELMFKFPLLDPLIDRELFDPLRWLSGKPLVWIFLGCHICCAWIPFSLGTEFHIVISHIFSYFFIVVYFISFYFLWSLPHMSSLDIFWIIIFIWIICFSFITLFDIALHSFLYLLLYA